MGQFLSQNMPPASKFKVTDIPDLTGKVMMVTGGSGDIGKEIARALLAHNAKVYLAARDVEGANTTIAELKKDTGKEAEFLKLDLSSLADVRRAADEFLSKETALHALYNNAGIMYLFATEQSSDVTEDGYDIQWGTNVVGPFLLTQLLMPAILKAAEDPQDKPRITFTSSFVQTKDIKWGTLKDTKERQTMSPSQRYMQSKFGNVVLGYEFAKRYGEKGVVVTSLNPGGLRTGLQRNMPGVTRRLLQATLHPPAMGAITHLWAGTSADGKDLNGKYLIPWARVGPVNKEAQNEVLRKNLWDYLEKEVKEN